MRRLVVGALCAALMSAGCWHRTWRRVEPEASPTVEDSTFARVKVPAARFVIAGPHVAGSGGSAVISGAPCRETMFGDFECSGRYSVALAQVERVDVQRREWNWVGFAVLTACVAIYATTVFSNLSPMDDFGGFGDLGGF